MGEFHAGFVRLILPNAVKHSSSILPVQSLSDLSVDQKIEKLQDAGNKLRDKFGNDILSPDDSTLIFRTLFLDPGRTYSGVCIGC